MLTIPLPAIDDWSRTGRLKAFAGRGGFALQ
jgi:hypothetical protein